MEDRLTIIDANVIEGVVQFTCEFEQRNLVLKGRRGSDSKVDYMDYDERTTEFLRKHPGYARQLTRLAMRILNEETCTLPTQIHQE